VWKDRPTVQLPEAAPQALIGNEDMLITHSETDKGAVVFRIIDTATGKIGGDIKIDNERCHWRGLSSEGILYIVTNVAIYAYDCTSILKGAADTNRPLWRRNDIRVRWATASAITMDGLIVVKSDTDTQATPVCLASEDGQNRWPKGNENAPTIRINTSTILNTGWTYLRSYVDGEQVIYQTQTGMQAFYSSDGEESWRPTVAFGAADTEGYPVIFPAQMAGQYMVTLSYGSSSNNQFYAKIIGVDSRPNKGYLRSERNIKDAGQSRKLEATRWQVIDNAFIIESLNKTYLYKAVTNEKPAGAK
jgi:hypothetical protein